MGVAVELEELAEVVVLADTQAFYLICNRVNKKTLKAI